ncbi:MAG: hypothetical protein LBC95_00030 [Candidatus Nomurabacteria bacterium]|jgi:hypothetical protein|nr:hypothetical protein [Candidatus Nomurabacteria bacterium]
MSDDIDFTKIDKIMAEMEDDKNFVRAVAADVAKSEAAVETKAPTKAKAKTTRKSPTKKTAPKKSPAQKKPRPAAPETEDGGALVKVNILTKSKPEIPEVKPNPRTGKYMDLVNPLSDMSIQGDRPGNPLPEIIIVEDEPDDEPVEITTKVIAVVEEVEVDDPDMGPTVGELMDEYEAGADEDDEPEIEPEPTPQPQPDEEPEGADDDPNGDRPFDDIMAELGDDDELSFSDLEKPFLENVAVEQRPLGGGDPVVKEINLNELLQAEAELAVDEADEENADQDFISNKTSDKWLGLTALKSQPSSPAKPEQPAPPVKKTSSAPISTPGKSPKSSRRGVGVFLTIALVILLVVLGAAVGALVYFSTQY